MAMNWSLAGQPRDTAGEVMNAFQQGRTTAANRDAAQGLAQGDYGRARNAFAQIDNPDAVMAVQGYQNDAQDRQQRQERGIVQDKRQAVGFEQQQRAFQLQETGRALGDAKRIAESMITIGDPAARYQMFQQQGVPALLAMGVPQETIDSAMTDQAISDQELQSFIVQAGGTLQQIEQEYQAVNLGEGGVGVFNKNSGEFRTIREPYRAPDYQKLGYDETLVNPDAPAQANGDWNSFYSNFVAPQEGGFAQNDGNGSPANFGINQGANPDVNVSELSQGQAQQILHDRYWVESGADKLPPGLAEIQGDTAINMGVATANRLLEQSGGDPQRYLQLREQRYRQIASNPDMQRFLPTWLRRNQQLSEYVSGGARVIARGAPKPDAPAAAPRISDGQRNTAGLVYRTEQASGRLNSLAERGITAPSAASIITDKSGAIVRLAAQSENDRLFFQAAREWIAPVLRKDTGAAVTESELIYYMDMYIPIPGDSPAVLQQKASARQDMMRAMRNQSGAAWDESYSDQPEPVSRWGPGPNDVIGGAPTAPAAAPANPGGGQPGGMSQEEVMARYRQLRGGR